MTDFVELNKKNKYQMPTPTTVVCEEWTVFINGGPVAGGKAICLTVPLPDCPPEKYDGFMRNVREEAIQQVRIAAKERLKIPEPMRVRIASRRGPLVVPASPELFIPEGKGKR